MLHAPRFVDLAPAEVVATLLDEGIYLASERTMYRILAEDGQTGEQEQGQVCEPRAEFTEDNLAIAEVGRKQKFERLPAS